MEHLKHPIFKAREVALLLGYKKPANEKDLQKIHPNYFY